MLLRITSGLGWVTSGQHFTLLPLLSLEITKKGKEEEEGPS
jgi:hypothetical protein